MKGDGDIEAISGHMQEPARDKGSTGFAPEFGADAEIADAWSDRARERHCRRTSCCPSSGSPSWRF